MVAKTMILLFNVWCQVGLDINLNRDSYLTLNFGSNTIEMFASASVRIY